MLAQLRAWQVPRWLLPSLARLQQRWTEKIASRRARQVGPWPRAGGGEKAANKARKARGGVSCVCRDARGRCDPSFGVWLQGPRLWADGFDPNYQKRGKKCNKARKRRVLDVRARYLEVYARLELCRPWNDLADADAGVDGWRVHIKDCFIILYDVETSSSIRSRAPPTSSRSHQK